MLKFRHFLCSIAWNVNAIFYLVPEWWIAPKISLTPIIHLFHSFFNFASQFNFEPKPNRIILLTTIAIERMMERSLDNAIFWIKGNVFIFMFRFKWENDFSVLNRSMDCLELLYIATLFTIYLSISRTKTSTEHWILGENMKTKKKRVNLKDLQ